jgi:hypothetical protein
MLAFGVAALASLCLVGATMAQAQLLDLTTHEVKLSSSAMAYVPMAGLVKEGGKVTLPVVLRAFAANAATGGFDYNITVLLDMGPGACGEITIGTISTYTGEESAVVNLSASGFPGPGQTLVGRLFAKVKTTTGKSGLKTVAGWTEVADGVAPDPDGISKKAQLKATEKDPAKLVDCTVP